MLRHNSESHDIVFLVYQAFVCHRSDSFQAAHLNLKLGLRGSIPSHNDQTHHHSLTALAQRQ
jgi:hypothetical protein